MTVLSTKGLCTAFGSYSQRSVLEQGHQGSDHGPKPVGSQEAFGQCSWIYGLTFRLPCVESGVGLNDPHGPFPTQDIAWFYDLSIFYFSHFPIHGYKNISAIVWWKLGARNKDRRGLRLFFFSFKSYTKYQIMLLIYYAIEVSSVREGQTKKLICKLKLSSSACYNGWLDFYNLPPLLLSLYSALEVSPQL